MAAELFKLAIELYLRKDNQSAIKVRDQTRIWMNENDGFPVSLASLGAPEQQKPQFPEVHEVYPPPLSYEWIHTDSLSDPVKQFLRNTYRRDMAMYWLKDILRVSSREEEFGIVGLTIQNSILNLSQDQSIFPVVSTVQHGLQPACNVRSISVQEQKEDIPHRLFIFCQHRGTSADNYQMGAGLIVLAANEQLNQIKRAEIPPLIFKTG